MAKEFFERYGLTHFFSRKGKSTLLQPGEGEIKNTSAQTINSLLGYEIPENPEVGMGKAPIYVIKIPGETPRHLELIAVINRPLLGGSFMKYLNEFSPRQRRINNASDEILWLNDVVADWAYMSSPRFAGQKSRNTLEGVHAQFPGFAEFMPNAPQFIAACGATQFTSQYGIHVEPKPIVPVVHFSIEPAGRITWHHTPIPDGYQGEIVRIIGERYKNADTVALRSSSLNRFLGMTIPAYTHSELTAKWPQEIRGQEMSIAQVPVLNFMHSHEHTPTKKPIVGALVNLGFAQ